MVLLFRQWLPAVRMLNSSGVDPTARLISMPRTVVSLGQGSRVKDTSPLSLAFRSIYTMRTTVRSRGRIQDRRGTICLSVRRHKALVCRGSACTNTLAAWAARWDNFQANRFTLEAIRQPTDRCESMPPPRIPGPSRRPWGPAHYHRRQPIHSRVRIRVCLCPHSSKSA